MTIIIVGGHCAGKTTLGKLLTKHYENRIKKIKNDKIHCVIGEKGIIGIVGTLEGADVVHKNETILNTVKYLKERVKIVLIYSFKTSTFYEQLEPDYTLFLDYDEETLLERVLNRGTGIDIEKLKDSVKKSIVRNGKYLRETKSEIIKLNGTIKENLWHTITLLDGQVKS